MKQAHQRIRTLLRLLWLLLAHWYALFAAVGLACLREGGVIWVSQLPWQDFPISSLTGLLESGPRADYVLLSVLFVLLLASFGLLCWTLALLGELALAQHRRTRAARERAAARKASEQQTTSPTHNADPAEQLLQRRDDLRLLMQDLQGKLAQL